MWSVEIFKAMENAKDDVQSKKMSAYMQDKFAFLGIARPKLNEIMKPYIKEGKKAEIDWNFVNECWNKDYREAQYVGIEYLNQYVKKFTDKDIDKLKYLVINKSWWETVDSIDSMFGEIVLKYPEQERLMLKWSTDKNMWLRRVSINFQQRYKEKTNIELLEKIIVNNFGTDEFFINKAIGWSLRDYSKVNPNWVRDFINKYEKKMDKLSIKEASKYL